MNNRLDTKLLTPTVNATTKGNERVDLEAKYILTNNQRPATELTANRIRREISFLIQIFRFHCGRQIERPADHAIRLQ